MTDIERVQQLLNSSNRCISIITDEEKYALEIIRQAAVNLKRDLWLWSVAQGVRDGMAILDNCPSIPGTDSPETGLVNLQNAADNSICVTLDLADYLKSGKPLRVLRDLISHFNLNGNSLVMIDSSDKLPEVIKSYVTPLEMSYPSENELLDIIRSTLRRIHQKTPIGVGITQKGLDAVVKNLRGLTRRQAEQIITDTVGIDQRFDDNDINRIIAGKRRLLQVNNLLEYIQTPLDLTEIGGMKNLKRWLKLRNDVFSAKAENFGLNAPRGLLVLGVQGAGKSLCAKAIATAWQQPLLRLDPSTLYASYIGESEHNLRQALLQTEQMSPVILWIDEIEKAFASAASRSADGGLSQRMFGTLLTWLQERRAPVFVVATANDIDALPPELLRKGRFDEIFFVDLPKADARKSIFEIHLKKRKRDPRQYDLQALASASEGYSGAEIEQAVISAMFEAYAQGIDLQNSHLLDALKTSPPLSVTMAEKVQALKAWSKGRTVPAD